MPHRHGAGVRAAIVAALLGVQPVQAQYFGRNKVQYRSFDFDIIRTEHFDVYYYDRERTASVDAARMVERSYGRLSRLLQHEFRDRKPLIVYASHTDFQQTNALPMFISEGTGGVTEAIKSRMILPFTGAYADFDHVLTHELVHAFQYDVIFRRGVVTDASPFSVRLPLWFMEGMAEYLSIGRVDPHTESWLRDAVLSGYLRTIEDMNQRDDYLSYRFGQSLWAYIGSKWGDEVVGILLQRAPRVGLDRAFSATLGLTLDELSDEWLHAVRQQYLPQVAELDPPMRFATRLTKHNRIEDPWFLAPAISPDGRKMVFLSQRDGFFFELYLADAESGAVERKLVSSAGNADFESLRYLSSSAAFSPDGRHLAFAAQAAGEDALYVYDVDRNAVVRQLRFGLNGVANPSWSPDARRIVFTGLDGGLSDLFVTDLDGRAERLTNDRYADLLPAWSPDGRSIAFSTDRGRDTDLDRLRYGELRVALYHLDSGAIDVLPNQSRGKNINPAWSPDGRHLIWVSDRTGTNDLYLYGRERGDLNRITEVLSGVIAITPLSPVLSWSRSGRLLFTYFEEAGYNIYAVEDPLSLPRTRVAEPVVAQTEALTDGGSDAGSDGVPALPPPFAQRGSAVPVRPAFPGSYYREGDAFRGSATAPVTAATATRPVSVKALLDSAMLALPDTSSFAFEDYRVKFSPDLVGRPSIGASVGGYYGNGLYGSSYITLSDMLGNHNIVAAASLNGSLADASFYSGYTFLKTRANVGAAISQTPLYRYVGSGLVPLDIDGSVRDAAVNVFRRDLVRSAQLLISYPFSTFRRIELGANGVLYGSDMLYRGIDRATGDVVREDERLGGFAYMQPLVALVFDNSLHGWTGPVYGRRYRLQLSRTFGELRFTELLADVRNYWNVEQKVILASRLVGLMRSGADADRFALFWGGPYYLRGYDGGSFDLDSNECIESRVVDGLSPCPVRDQLIGSSFALANLEVRVPVITELQIGFLGTFPPVDAVLFADAGMAWDTSVCGAAEMLRPTDCESPSPVDRVWQRQAGQDPVLFRQPLMSWGLGLRINVFYTVLRLDYAFPLNRPRRSVFSLSFGPSF